MRRGALERPAGPEPPERHQPPRRPRVLATLAVETQDGFGAEREHDVDVAPDFEPVKPGRGNADDFDRALAQGDRAADDRGIAAVGALPETVPEDGARRASGFIVCR